MLEVNKTTCKVCQQIKERIAVGEYTSKSKKYIDDQGKLWNGKVCPQCVVNKSREHMRKRRAELKGV